MIRSIAVAVPLLVTLSLYTACGSDSATVAPTTTADASAPDDAAPASPVDAAVDAGPVLAPSLHCPADCLPPAPPGWTGPSAMYAQAGIAQVPSCPPAYPLPELAAQEATDGQVACACVLAAPARCEQTVSAWNAAGCTGAASTTSKVSFNGTSSCVLATLDPATKGVEASDVPELVATWQAMTTAPLRGDKLVANTVASCKTADAPAVCNGRNDCITVGSPDPYHRVCIHQAGVQSCPSEDYAVRKIVWRTLHDDRVCSCAGAGSCGTKANTKLYDDPGCTTTPTDFSACRAITASPTYVHSEAAPTGVAGTATLAGALVTQNAETFCCNE